MRVFGGLLVGALVTIVLTLLPVSPAQAQVCQHRTGVSHGGGIFPNPFTEDSICGHQAGAPVYATADSASPQVGVLDGTQSWFLCWTRGQQHGGGNNVWYYTQGDRVVNNPERHGYGFVPASHLNTSNDPQDAQLAQCPPVPSESSTAYMVYDRTTGASTQSQEHKQLRSASLVKLLIAIDYLEARTPGSSIPAADAQLLQTMLRSSDDTAANTLWVRDGWEAIVNRMVTKIGLIDTAPPADRGMWGYTALSASDVVKIYRYILERAHPTIRDLIMGHLRQATRCAADGWDQYFGIPSAIPRPWAVKQGWSAFGEEPPQCGSAAGRTASPGPSSRTASIDLSSPAMHTSGTFCANDRKIMVVLTLNPIGTTWNDAATRLTTKAADLYNTVGC
ncbi:hypothetical protein AB0395_40320 [Streptosporangium sp. NPDC051023]|uniref:hypothetical protein n=1 Tax=Streptosporangium sp. NPDC051023 TaxID=3155410 RepID=UPI0034505F05